MNTKVKFIAFPVKNMNINMNIKYLSESHILD